MELWMKGEGAGWKRELKKVLERVIVEIDSNGLEGILRRL